MEPALKQRLIGAAVLVALAVIFLPMLIKGPAPESGVADVPLDLPTAPQGEYETRELPLVAPGAANAAGVVGLEGDRGDVLPTVDTTRPGAADNAGEANNDNGGMMPPATAGGGYAVSFGSYASTADADRVVGALRASQLPGYQDAVTSNGRTLHRVRIGPFDSQATAEAARLRAAHVRDDVGSKVVALDAGAAAAGTTRATASTPTPAPSAAPVKTAPLPESASPPPPARKPVAAPVADTKAATAAPVPAQPKPAAADVGFAIQLGAFSNDADAVKLRDRTRAMGFSAFVEKVQTDKGTLSRVRVGPVASRADAERLKAQVAEKTGISGFIQSHP